MGTCCAKDDIDPEAKAFVNEIEDEEEKILAAGLLKKQDGGGTDVKSTEMSKGQLIRIWKKFDQDGNDLLDKKELENLLRKFLTLADDYFDHEKHLHEQDLDTHLATTLGLAVAAQKFDEEDILERFKDDPELVTDKVFGLLDSDGNGELSREEFLERAPKVLFNKGFLEKTAEVYSQDVWEARLKSNFVFQDDMEICTLEEMQSILFGCPKYCYWMQWHRLFSTTKDGFSFSTVKEAIGSLREVLIVIRTTKDYLVGGFASEHIIFDGNVHGNTDNFVFSKPADSHEVSIHKADGEKMSKFHVGSRDSLMFGPDAEKLCALFISEEMLTGRSTKSHTYTNDDSLHEDEEFTIKSMEIWGPIE